MHDLCFDAPCLSRYINDHHKYMNPIPKVNVCLSFIINRQSIDALLDTWPLMRICTSHSHPSKQYVGRDTKMHAMQGIAIINVC